MRKKPVYRRVVSPEPFEEPGAYLEVEEPGAGSLLGGQGGRGELEAGGGGPSYRRSHRTDPLLKKYFPQGFAI
jgi:hypothetical protein